ncbi:GL15497 [Drosophila persimilis]|uniref:Odorant receptor n=1 Tax=Drosophila persimilis TaxID=7234 RepID=B4H6K7_DROPE|nr:odorant receptor 74a [Drosophila persimilis]EDW33435.1 GL15497 [Drosophila persimilis]
MSGTRYRPRLADGELAPLPWPVALYRKLNHISWPLEVGVAGWTKHLESFVLIVGFLIFCEHNEVDFHYLIVNRNDIDNFLTGMPTYLILVEMQIRCFQLAWHKNRFRSLLQRFYKDIYVQKDSEPQLFAHIQSQMLATRLNSIVYLLALFNFLLVPFQNIIYHRREMLYKQVYPFDNTQLRYLIPLIGLNFWVGVIVTSMLFGELNVLGEMMMHLNARYVQLGQDLRRSAQRLLGEANQLEMAASYRRELTRILRRNGALHEFGEQIEQEFSFRIFVMFAFSAGLLCALCFKAYTNPLGNVVYIVWFLAKFMELLSLGTLGSILYKTTDDLALMYYTANWEQVVHQSNNRQENLRLMKLVTLAIQLNSRPFFITGLKYFRVSLAAVLKIIQGAFSYFTFLNSMR